ncbi:TetR family transcriptional regulator [Streptomyces sp. IBSBF 3352]|uniref:TetR family transcriptional regulator n=1 Tax=Streptomyces sp. IBSBF 3352 TaxID=2903523 RepID=UPI003FA68C4D
MAHPASFQRARSAEATQARAAAILEAAHRLGRERGIRDVSLTNIAAEVGMHKSALLRYFEAREPPPGSRRAPGTRSDLHRHRHGRCPVADGQPGPPSSAV